MTQTASRRLLCVLSLWFLFTGSLRGFGQDLTSSKETSQQISQEIVDVEFFSTIQQVKQAKQKGNQAEIAASENLIWRNPVPYIALLGDAQASLLGSFRAQVQEWRTDTQVGSAASSPGSTSLVSKGSVPSLLGLAVENGALTQTTSGTSVTFRTNPTGLVSALQKHGYAESGPNSYSDPVVKFVSRLSAAVTFNTNPGSSTAIGANGGAVQGTQAGTFTAAARQISNFDFRYDIINHRDPRDPKYDAQWRTIESKALTPVAVSVGRFTDLVQGESLGAAWAAAEREANSKKQRYAEAEADEQKTIDASKSSDAETRAANLALLPSKHRAVLDAQAAWQRAEGAAQKAEDEFKARDTRFKEWRAQALTTLDKAGPDSLNSAVLAVAKDFVDKFGDDPELRAAAKNAADEIAAYLKASGGLRNVIDKSPILTFEYSDIRQGTMTTAMAMATAGVTTAMPVTNLPDLSSFKLIVAGGTVGGATLTGNASLTLFNSNPLPPDKGRIRDFQLSGQADIPLREIQSIGVPTLTFSGLFLSLRRQPLGMPVQVNGVNVNLKGNIGFAQAKVSFPVKKGSGVNVPLSITYASRTELNKEHDIRGSIGMTLNLDTIFAGLKP